MDAHVYMHLSIIVLTFGIFNKQNIVLTEVFSILFYWKLDREILAPVPSLQMACHDIQFYIWQKRNGTKRHLVDDKSYSFISILFIYW